MVNEEKCNQQMLLNEIKKIQIDVNSFKLFPAANKQIRIQVNDIENYDKILAMLKDDEISHYTHAIKDRVKPVYIIKNLCKNFSLDEIKEDINRQNFEVLDISRFETKFHTENNIDSKMVRVTLPENTDTKSFEKIRFLLHMRVYIQTLKPSKILQCKRCQRLHHSSNYCNFDYRCVKCNDKHDPGHCKLNALGNTYKPRCCNCGGEHIASSYSCPYIANELNKNKKRNTQDSNNLFGNDNKKTDGVNAAVSTKKTFANIVNSNKQNPTAKMNVLNNLKSCMIAMQQTIELLIAENG